jgi:catalase (peroxidase I)
MKNWSYYSLFIVLFYRFVPFSVADSIQLAASTAVTSCGGPVIPFRPGRLDVLKGDKDPYFNLLPFNPYMSFSELLSRFSGMGLNQVDLLTLVVGSHTIG